MGEGTGNVGALEWLFPYEYEVEKGTPKDRTENGLITSESIISKIAHKPGDLCLFELEPKDSVNRSLLSIVKRFEPGIMLSSNSIPLRYANEILSFKPECTPLMLFDPFIYGGNVEPQFETYSSALYEHTTLNVNKISSGRENIMNSFLANPAQKFYAEFMKQGRLVHERGLCGEWLANLGMESLLPNTLRFRKPIWVSLDLGQLL
ncbi:MAG: hypothetical protein WCK90_01435 [archaeon]